MFSTILEKLQQGRMYVINELGNSHGEVMDEIGSMTPVRIQMKLRELQDKHKSLSQDIAEFSREGKEYEEQIRNLYLEKTKISELILFLYSNRLEHLDMCFKLYRDNPLASTAFQSMLEGLDAFRKNLYLESYELLKKAEKLGFPLEEHPLCNECLGKIYMHREDYERAKKYISYAKRFEPYRLDLYALLNTCYEKTNSLYDKRELIAIQELLGGE